MRLYVFAGVKYMFPFVPNAAPSYFPLVAVDTLAYQYSQPPPNITKPEPNVIIRLCDISSNSGAQIVSVELILNLLY